MAKYCDVATSRPGAGNDPVGSPSDLLRRLPIGHSVGPQTPSRTILSDVDRSTPLVIAIVPLEKIVGLLGNATEAGDSTCFRRPGQRAREHLSE